MIRYCDRHAGLSGGRKAIAIAAARREAGTRVSIAITGAAITLILMMVAVALRLG